MRSYFMYSPALNLTGTRTCEVDLLVIQHGEQTLRSRDATLRGLIEVGVGECKDAGGRIDQRDVDNLLWVREQFERKSIRCVVIFSKSADEFSADELVLFRRLAERRVPLILLTNRELEPYDPYEEYRDVALPERYAFTLDDMAANSRFIYLRR